MNTPTGKQPIKCDGCGKSFHDIGLLNTHKTTHNLGKSQSAAQNVENVCTWWNLKKHVKKIPVGDKHMNIHTGEHPSCVKNVENVFKILVF